MDQDSKDANSLLVELDRGLQSGDPDAVAKFTSLLQRYPLPTSINSACLKLASAYRNGSNFIRIKICDVLQQNQSHLHKIYNIDDFFKNIFTVTTSNDPIARSITLLTLGMIAPIVSDYKNVHHCISSSLDASVKCELNSTIACAASYAKHSAEFACNIYPKIISIIESNKSSIDTKIRALSVLDHGFYNANDAMIVRSFLINVIETSRLKKLICACLTLTTKISHKSLSHITSQIELLLKIFSEDSRHVIRLNALRNLKFLAEKSPHIWESSHVEPLVAHMESILISTNKSQDSEDPYVSTLLSIFCKLLTCKCNFVSQPEKTRIYRQSFRLALKSDNLPLCSMAFELITVMSEEQFHSSSKNAIEFAPNQPNPDILNSIKAFLGQPLKAFHDSQDSCDPLKEKMRVSALKNIYRHIVKLCELNPQYCPELIKLIFDKISSKETSLSELNPYYTELMCAITQYSNEFSLTPDKCWKLIKTKSDISEANLLNLCVLYFQMTRLNTSHEVTQELVDKVTKDHSLWFTFKVMRQAMRYGHYKLAGSICEYLHEQVTSDTQDNYLKALGRICSAECLLHQADCDIEANLTASLPIYENSLAPIRASFLDECSSATNFQLQFLSLRIRTLQVHTNLRQYCTIYELAPITYDALLRARTMSRVALDFRQLGESYESLAQVECRRSSDYVSLLKSSCVIMADTIDAIFQYKKNLRVVNRFTNKNLALEQRDLEASCHKLIELVNAVVVKPGGQKLVDASIINLLRLFSNEILKCPYSYPRYFFQHKLAYSELRRDIRAKDD